MEKLNDGIRLPDLRYKEIQKACWLTLMVIDGEMRYVLKRWKAGRGGAALSAGRFFERVHFKGQSVSGSTVTNGLIQVRKAFEEARDGCGPVHVVLERRNAGRFLSSPESLPPDASRTVSVVSLLDVFRDWIAEGTRFRHVRGA